jgi:hypothetical protein
MTAALNVAIIGGVGFSRSMFEVLAALDGVKLCGVATLRGSESGCEAAEAFMLLKELSE